MNTAPQLIHHRKSGSNFMFFQIVNASARTAANVSNPNYSAFHSLLERALLPDTVNTDQQGNPIKHFFVVVQEAEHTTIISALDYT
jgi:hypothetical protein